jgi:hypothetical protein
VAQKISNLVDSYLDSTNRWLLRWSLLVAQKKKCYLCGDPVNFVGTEIDHVIPQTEKVDFNSLWAQIGGGLPNNGVHHISNLRAACDDCNSARIKGHKVLSVPSLDLILQNSNKIMEAAFKAQEDIRRNGDTAESLVKVATSNTEDDFDLLWDVDLNQAVVAAFHAGSARIAAGRDPIIPLYVGNRRVSARLGDESRRLLAAVHLLTGVSVSQLLSKAVECGIKTVDDSAADFASRSYEDLQGAVFGTVDWPDHTEIPVSVAEFEIDTHAVSCVVTIPVDEDLSLPVSQQSDDGGDLEGQQTKSVEVTGNVRVHATMDVGHNPSGKGGLTVWVEDDLDVSHS